MNYTQLSEAIYKKKSFLCIGLDSDPDKIPPFLRDTEDPVFEFNRQIIAATHDLCVAYKINTAFYESMGEAGWRTMQKTVEAIPGGIFTIADAKRGDIGNTSGLYAKAFFETLCFDAVTVSPYMGSDSVSPFMAYKGKWVILLALTSNEGALDFQLSGIQPDGQSLFEQVVSKSLHWGSNENMMYVVGATRGELIGRVRKIAPDHFLLIPGVGTQGGSLAEVCRHGMNKSCGMLVNSSRHIIYAGGNDVNFAEIARTKAHELQLEMKEYL